MKFWDSSQWNIGVISNFECINRSLNLWLNWRRSINLNWCSFNWNESFSIDSHRLGIFGISRNEILTINSENSWFFRSWFNHALEYASIWLWNYFKWNVSQISDIESIYFALLIDFNFSFNGIVGFWFIDWNIDNSSNYYLLVRLTYFWFVKNSINFDSSCFDCCIGNWNFDIFKDCLVDFWNNFQWNVSLLSNYNWLNNSSVSFSLYWGCNFDSGRCLFDWNVDYFINDHWSDFLGGNRAEKLSVHIEHNFGGCWLFLGNINFATKYTSVYFWYNN